MGKLPGTNSGIVSLAFKITYLFRNVHANTHFPHIAFLNVFVSKSAHTAPVYYHYLHTNYTLHTQKYISTICPLYNTTRESVVVS